MIASESQAVRGRRGGARRSMAACFGFARHALHRFNADGCFVASGALSYTTLVSLVPLAVLALGSLSAFPIFAPVRAGLMALLFKTFVPSVGEQAAFWFRNFADSATQTTAIGFAGIATTGVLVLVTVEDQLNLIWSVKQARPWAQRVLAYWALITLGPLLIGLSLTLSTYLEVAARETSFGARALGWFAGDWLHWLARGIPPVLEFLALNLLYWLIPNCSVRWRDSALGALVATVAIEVLKIGFSIYIGAASYYRTVYGTLAAIPIFLLWMYISWMAVLLGAIVAAAAPNWHGAERPGDDPLGDAPLGLSLALVAALARAQRRGAAMTDRALAAELGVGAATIGGRMRPLAVAGFAARTQEGGWVLIRNPETLTLRDLYEALRLPLAKGWGGRGAAPWQRQVAPAMEHVVTAEKAAMRVTVAALISETIDPTIAGAAPRGSPATARQISITGSKP